MRKAVPAVAAACALGLLGACGSPAETLPAPGVSSLLTEITPSPSPSTTPSASVAPRPAPVAAADLRALSTKDDRVLLANVIQPLNDPQSSSPCTARLRPRLVVPEGAKVLYLACDEGDGFIAHAARVMPGSTSPRALVQAWLAGPTKAEAAAGFLRSEADASLPFTVAVVGDVVVLDFLDRPPSDVITFPLANNSLVMTLTQATGARGVSFLVRHKVTCGDTTCP